MTLILIRSLIILFFPVICWASGLSVGSVLTSGLSDGATAIGSDGFSGSRVWNWNVDTTNDGLVFTCDIDRFSPNFRFYSEISESIEVAIFTINGVVQVEDTDFQTEESAGEVLICQMPDLSAGDILAFRVYPSGDTQALTNGTQKGRGGARKIKIIGYDGFGSDGSWQFKADSSNIVKFTWDRARFCPSVLVYPINQVSRKAATVSSFKINTVTKTEDTDFTADVIAGGILISQAGDVSASDVWEITITTEQNEKSMFLLDN